MIRTRLSWADSGIWRCVTSRSPLPSSRPTPGIGTSRPGRRSAAWSSGTTPDFGVIWERRLPWDTASTGTFLSLPPWRRRKSRSSTRIRLRLCSTEWWMKRASWVAGSSRDASDDNRTVSIKQKEQQYRSRKKAMVVESQAASRDRCKNC